MFDDKVRAILPQYIKPVISLLAKFKVTPNQVSVFGFLLSLIAAFLISSSYLKTGIFVWWLSRLADGLDGNLARSTNQKSNFGGYLDILFDMGSYSIVVIGFAFVYPELNLVWSLMLFAHIMCITSTLALASILEKQKVHFENNNRSIQFTSGLAEGGETSLAYTLFVFFPEQIKFIAAVWFVMSIYAVVQRTVLAFKLLQNQSSETLNSF